jgi:hypothetical protein
VWPRTGLTTCWTELKLTVELSWHCAECIKNLPELSPYSVALRLIECEALTSPPHTKPCPDSEDIGKMNLGVKALATFPLKSEPSPSRRGGPFMPSMKILRRPVLPGPLRQRPGRGEKLWGLAATAFARLPPTWSPNLPPHLGSKRDPGLRDVPVTFAGVTFHPGSWCYADKDGLLVSAKKLKL